MNVSVLAATIRVGHCAGSYTVTLYSRKVGKPNVGLTSTVAKEAAISRCIMAISCSTRGSVNCAEKNDLNAIVCYQVGSRAVGSTSNISRAAAVPQLRSTNSALVWSISFQYNMGRAGFLVLNGMLSCVV